MTDQKAVIPFLKWAGGKRWLFDANFLQRLPSFERYAEPFLGGGAGFFALNPKRAILSDVNAELIDLYRTIRDFPKDLSSALKRHQDLHSENHYYSTRSASPVDKIEAAARMLYLNRTCWNGLYRLNRAGQFNVPIGTKTAVMLATDDFVEASKRLKNADLKVCDFEATLLKCGKGDLIFVDPPYTVKHNMNGFVKYNEKIFSWSDQVRLAEAAEGAAARGASVIITNADHASVRELYESIGKLETVERASVISGKSEGRARTSELIVRL